MKSLETNVINQEISRRAIVSMQRLLQFNYEVTKQNPFDDFFCYGLIDAVTIRRSKCSIRIVDSHTLETLWRDENFSLANFPQKLLRASRSSQHVHVLVRIRMFYNQKMHYMIIVPIGEERLGYRSNYLKLHSEGRYLLEQFFKKYQKDKMECWSIIPLMQYGLLRRLISKTPLS
jgi:hypothetical protein